MKKACVIGYPIHQSLSPSIHNYWIKSYNIVGEYSSQSVKEEDFSDFILYNKTLYKGWNVTLPYKEKIVPYCDILSDIAKKVKAVNTIVVNEDGSIFGDNTDVYGFQKGLEIQTKEKLEKNKAVIIGAGGAARAAIVGLLNMGFKEIFICNRTKQKADDLAQEFCIKIFDYKDLNYYVKDSTCVINTTSLGLMGKGSIDISFKNTYSNCVVYDIVYNPLYTEYLKNAQKYNLTIATGLYMLLYQASIGFKYWFGKNPKVTKELHEMLINKL